MQNRIKNLRFIKAKTGGAQQGGALCGVYQGDIDGNKRTFLAKKEPTLGKNACELAASIIANSLHEHVITRRAERALEEKGSEPDRSERFAVVKAIPAADLADSREEMKVSEEKETYVASLFASAHCKDFWEFAYDQYLGNDEVFRRQRRGNKHTYLQKPAKRPQFLGTGEPKTVFDTVMGAIVKRNPHFLQEFSDVRTVNFILGNLDNHFGNIVISYDGADEAEPSLENLHLHSIDFAGAFDPAYTKFNELVSPLRNGVSDPQPTNHNDEYSRRWRITNEMAMACDDYREAIHERKKEISQRVAEEVVENFSVLEVQAYLLRIMGKNAKIDNFDALDDSQKRKYLKDKIYACVLDDLEKRASEQCEQEAFEIRLSLCFDPIQPDHPESGFKINLKKLNHFFENTQQQDLKKRIRKAKFRKIGQEDFSDELQKMTIDVLTDWRVLKTKMGNPVITPVSPELQKEINAFEKKHANKRTHAPVSLEKRLRNALFDIYELSPTSSSWARFKKGMGWPAAGTINYLPFKILRFLAFLPRTLLKFGYELLPEMGAQIFGWMRDRGLDYLQNKSKRPFASPGDFLNHVIAGFCVLVGGIASPSLKSIRLIGMRVASPLRSVKEAYHFGFKWGNKVGQPVGYILGAAAAVVSMAVSMAGIMATSILVMPYVAAGLSAVGLGGAVAWVGSAASTVLGLQGLSTVYGAVSLAAKSIGLVTTALAVVSGLTAPIAPLLKGVWNAIKNKSRKKSVHDMSMSHNVPFNKNECSNNSVKRLLPEPSSRLTSRSTSKFIPIPNVCVSEDGRVSRQGLLARSLPADSAQSTVAREENTFHFKSI